MPALLAVAEVLSALGAVLERLGVRWYVFGAQAVVIHGEPRMTADVDVTVALGQASVESLVRALGAEGFDPRVVDVDAFVARTRVIPFVHRSTALPLDVVLAGTPLEEQFLARARPVDVGGVVVPVISPEDLVVAKILAGRPKDLDDVVGVLRERGDALNLKQVRALLRQIGKALDRSDLLLLLSAARRKALRH